MFFGLLLAELHFLLRYSISPLLSCLPLIAFVQHFIFFIPLCCDQRKSGSTVQRPYVLRAPPLILLGGEDEEDGDQGVCVTPQPFHINPLLPPHTRMHAS